MGVNEVGAGESTGESVPEVLGVLSAKESEDASVWLDGGTRGAGVLHVGAGGTGGLEDMVALPYSLMARVVDKNLNLLLQLGLARS
jgi:hypothetical protein